MEQKEFNELMDAQKSAIVKEAKEAAASEIKEVSEKVDNLKTELNEVNAKAAEILKFGRGEKEKDMSFGGQLRAKMDESKNELLTLKNNRSASVPLVIKAFDFEQKAAGTITSANYSGGTQGLTTWDPEFLRVVRRSPFLRQIVRNRPIGSQGIAWAEMANPDPGAAGMTAEGAAKTQTDFDMVERRETSRKITSYIKVSKEALDDLPNLQAEINQELIELVELKLDEQILSGDNTGQNLKGILQYASAFSVASTSLAAGVDRANEFDVIRAAAWQIANTGKGKFLPNYVLVNPIDAAMMDLTKATDGQYIIPPFVSSSGQTIYGLKVIENVGVTAGDFVVGDFNKAVLGIREDITLNVGYENDDFTKNLVTILAEMRAFHYVKTNHAGSFVKGTFATAKAALETV